MSKRYDKPTQKYNSEFCDDTMTFQDCELAILRHAVDKSGEIQAKKAASSDDVKRIMKIVEDFLMDKQLVCYGGTAINNILPKFAQFYNRDIDIPDYDFFSDNALHHAKELSDIYFNAGYTDVEAKAGVHFGTYKVFVNFIPVADITFMTPALFASIKKEAIKVAGIHYAPPDFLRMSMYLELSRPYGDVSRWEKVLKRLNLLNKFYPLTKSSDCKMNFQRKMFDKTANVHEIYTEVRDILIDQGVVFFGGYAASLYSKYMPHYQQKLVEQNPDFDVLSEDIHRCSLIIRERLERIGVKNVKEIYHEPIGELIPERIQITVGSDTIAFIYSPLACHNYNIIKQGNKTIHVATIDTMLSFYLAFIFADEYKYTRDRILCMAQFLFDVEEHNRLRQEGVLERFSMNCAGKQPMLEDIRTEKADKYKELAKKRGTEEYEMWFLKYNPGEKRKAKKTTHKPKLAIPHNHAKINKTVQRKKSTGKAKRASKTKKNRKEDAPLLQKYIL